MRTNREFCKGARRLKSGPNRLVVRKLKLGVGRKQPCRYKPQVMSCVRHVCGPNRLVVRKLKLGVGRKQPCRYKPQVMAWKRMAL
jgi:hypothetical protein